MDKTLIGGGLIALFIGVLLVRLKLLQGGARQERKRQAKADIKKAKAVLQEEEAQDAAAANELEEVIRETEKDVADAGRGDDPVTDFRKRASRLRDWMERRRANREGGDRPN